MEENDSIPPKRYNYIDWLRVFGMMMVLLFHSARFFDLIGWDLKNSEVNRGVTIFIMFTNYWIMPLFFVLAGAGTLFALNSKNKVGYAEERFYRLMVPWVFGTFLLVPPQRYLSALQKGQYNGEMISFLPWYIEKKLSSANLGFDPIWFSEIGAHLWFLAVLFLFSILTLPIFSYFKSQCGLMLIKKLATIGDKTGGIYCFILPLMLVRVGLQPLFPKYSSWSDFSFWLLTFIFGYIFFSDQRFIKRAERYKYISLNLGILLLVVLIVLFVYFIEFVANCWGHPDYSWGSVFFYSLWAASAWIWVMFFLGVGKAFLDFKNLGLIYLNEATMPFYMLQQTVLMIIGFYVVQWNSGIALKFVVISSSALIAIIGVYITLIRPLAWVRVLFGMKQKKLQDRL